MSAETVAAQGGLAAIQPGMPVETFGLRQEWSVLAVTVLDDPLAARPEAILLAVRDHRVHPFVIELVYLQGADLVAYQGTYHPTLAEAVADYFDRGGRIVASRA